MSTYSDDEFKEITETDVTADAAEKADTPEEKKKEDSCYICGRPESVTGPLMRIPNNICICKDCMQKTFDSMSSAGFPMGDMTPVFGGANNRPNTGGMPNISMINLSDLAGMMPGAQRVK